MTQSPARASRDPLPLPSGLSLVRLLASLEEAPAQASKEGFAQRLGGWFEWMDAITLAGVLNAPDPSTETPRAAESPGEDALLRDVQRVKARLEKLTRGPSTSAPAPRGPRAVPLVVEPAETDFPALRQRYVGAQREMETQVGALRQRLRSALEGTSPGMARLAALDAVMERVVGERENLLLSGVPRWLEPHFKRRELAVFTRDLRTVLRAELELRWQPITALLEALRQPSLLPS